MQNTTLMLILVAMAATAFYLGRERSLALAPGPKKTLNLHSLPGYYGYFTAIWALLPALALALWSGQQQQPLAIMVEPSCGVHALGQSESRKSRLLSVRRFDIAPVRSSGYPLSVTRKNMSFLVEQNIRGPKKCARSVDFPGFYGDFWEGHRDIA